MSGVSGTLAAWVAGLGGDEVPGPVRRHLATCLLDAYGCGLFGATQPWGRIAADAARESGGAGRVPLFAGGGCGSPAEAALANGTAVHGFEIDDAHVASSLHPGAVVVPALLALLPGRQVTGRDLLTAMAAGYEAGLRLGVAAGVTHSTSGYHVTGTVGTVAAGMAAARLLGLGPDATRHALGIAATQAAGLYGARASAMTKRLHAGLAARAGVTGALLARRGFTGAPDVIEAEFGGFLSTLHGQHPADSLLAGLGETWETARVGFKAHASCASSHTTIDALDLLMAEGLSAATLASLELSFGRKSALNVGWPYRPGTVVAAQMNAQYVAAVKLLEGEVFVRQFREELLADPRVLDIVARITVRHDPEIDALGAARRHTVVARATTTDGRSLEARVEQRRGSADRPLAPGEIAAKFRAVAAASPVADAASLEAAILGIDDAPDAGAVLLAPLLGMAQPAR